MYVTGSAALVADQQQAGDRSLQVIEAVTFTVIIVMLLLVTSVDHHVRIMPGR